MDYKERIDIIDQIIDAVGETRPRAENDIWSDGAEILSKSKETITAIADLFDRIADNPVSCTGYYDPTEDEHDECVDEHTGFHYVTLA